MHKLKQLPRRWRPDSSTLAFMVLWGLACLASLGCGKSTAEFPGEEPTLWQTHKGRSNSVPSSQEGQWSSTGSMASPPSMR